MGTLHASRSLERPFHSAPLTNDNVYYVNLYLLLVPRCNPLIRKKNASPVVLAGPSDLFVAGYPVSWSIATCDKAHIDGGVSSGQLLGHSLPCTEIHAPFATANYGNVVEGCFPDASRQPGSVFGQYGTPRRWFAETDILLQTQCIDECALGASPHVAIGLLQRMIGTTF